MGESIRRLNYNLAGARAALADAGLVAAREGPALEAAFWAQLPGNFAWRARPAARPSHTFIALAPFHTYTAGPPMGNHWGHTIAMMTRALRLLNLFNFYVGDLCHKRISRSYTERTTIVIPTSPEH